MLREGGHFPFPGTQEEMPGSPEAAGIHGQIDRAGIGDETPQGPGHRPEDRLPGRRRSGALPPQLWQEQPRKVRRQTIPSAERQVSGERVRTRR